jgi:serine/threonine-protein phosphatase 5
MTSTPATDATATATASAAAAGGTPEDRFARAEAAKAEGNEHFKSNIFAKALISYTEAIDLGEGDDAAEDSLDSLDALEPQQSPNLQVYYANRAFCHIKMENYGSAIMDATKAIELKPDFGKGWYRRGTANHLLNKTKDALRDFTQVCKLAPQDRDAREKLKMCQKAIQEERFKKAIESENTKALSETLNLDALSLESSYEGPVYTSGKMTLEFCKELMEWQRLEKKLEKKYVYAIVIDIIKFYKTVEESCVDIDVPPTGEFTVCGDVHGQYYDLLNIWKINGPPSETNPYLFNGDFVDRGSFSTEVIIMLFAWKLLYPGHMHLSRGNHETRNMNMLYGFQGEVKQKFDADLYQLFCEAFCLLPLCHVIGKQIFVVHGGLFSEDNVTLNAIRKVDRDREPPDEGLMHEMLWSDPHPGRGRTPSKRGTGVAFGRDVTENFLKTNKLKLIIRSHEMKEQGFEWEHDKQLITIFSAPNYCDQMGNKGAFIRLDGKTLTPKFTSFEAVAHPSVKPMQYANPMLGQLMGM